MSVSSQAILPEELTAAGAAGGLPEERAEVLVGTWLWDFLAGTYCVDAHWCHAVQIDPCSGPDHLERWAREIHPDDAGEFRRKYAAVRAGRLERFEMEYRMLVNDSQWLWVLQRGCVVARQDNGLALRVSGICIEIDDRKRAQVALQENEARLATALWGARAAFWQWNVATDVVTMSPLWFAMTGYTREQWDGIANPWSSRIHPDDRSAVQQQMRRHLAGQSTSIEIEYRIQAASGEWKWMLTRGRAVEWDFEGNATSAIGVSLDIDMQKRAEAELLSSEARLETAVWGAGMGLWELDFRSGVTRWYSDWCDRLNLHPCDGQDHVSRWDANIHPQDVTHAAQRFSDHVAGKADYYDAEYRIQDRAGRWRWLFERGRVVERDAGGVALRMVGICMDIDERKEAELEYLRSQRRLEVALESARGGMWDWDLRSGESRHTEFYYRMLGAEPQAGESNSLFWNSRVHPEDLVRVQAAVNEVIDGRRELYEAEYRLRHESGSWRWVLDRGRAAERDAHGRALRMVGFLVEVTDRIEAQEALRQTARASEAVLRAVTENTPDWLFLLDEALRVRFMNRQFGPHRTEEVIGRSLLDFIPEPHRATLEQLYQRVLATGEPARFELQIQSDSGISHHEHRVIPVIESGVVRSLTVAVTEATARHSQRDALLTQARILETMREGVVLIDTTTHLITLTNQTFDKMFGYGPQELIGRSIDPLFSMPALQRRRFERTLRDGLEAVKALPVEFECSRKDGSRFVATCVITPLRISGSEGWLAVLNDVTERKRLEREIIEIANREQQRIGSDLHDGLGQDLTGIALMLRGVVAQLRKEGSAARLDIEDVIGLVNNAIENTRSLARGLSPVGGERGGLAAALQTLAARASERYGVRVEYHGDIEEPLRLSETAATHVYRIVQEALTNVFRHSRATHVVIGLASAGGELQLHVDDNGRGFEHGAPDSGGGLGMKIMRYRAQMLGGDLTLECGAEGGVSVRCSCPLDSGA